MTPEWISIADRQPEYDAPCLVAWDGSNAFKTPKVNRVACAIAYDADGWLWYEVDWGDFCEWDTDELPTHWAPYPLPPVLHGKPPQGAALDGGLSSGTDEKKESK